MNSFITLDKTNEYSIEIVEENAVGNNVIENIGRFHAMTRGWQCCKCQETMYDDEMNCTWDRCNHRRCKGCRSFTN
jgi:hypothetical protein